MISVSKMSVSTTLLSVFLLVFPCVTCFDITKLLSQYPAYSSFSNYLTQTQLAGDVNNSQNITVLAVDNSGMAPISGKSMDLIKKVLSIHVIMEYLDVQKLQHLGNQSITVRTLLDSTGQAQGLQGFIKITDLSTGAVSFVSASDSNSMGANLIKAVVSQPYNISVVQISTVIMPPSLLENANSPSPSSVSPSPPPPLPVPVISPVPVITPVPVISITPVPVESPVPTMPAPVQSPVPVVSPVPVPVPVTTPVAVPVISPVAVPVMTPIMGPVLSPVDGPSASDAPGHGGSRPSPSADAANGPGEGDAGDTPKSGLPKFGVNKALPILLTLLSTYVLSRSRHIM